MKMGRDARRTYPAARRGQGAAPIVRVHYAAMIRRVLLTACALLSMTRAAAQQSAPSCAAPLAAPARDSIARPLPPLVPTPNVVRGLYVNRWAAIGTRMYDLIATAQRTEINTLVIDVKDDRGFVLYRSSVPLARAIGADTNRPMRRDRLRAALDTMRALGIYPVARIVVIKDPLLAAARPQLAIRSRADTARAWHDAKKLPWLDPHQDEPWNYAADLACEAVRLGFSEVQFDYVRFPDDDRLQRQAAFPLARDRQMEQVIHDQLARTRGRMRPVRAPMTIDVFGLTTTDTTAMGIGQRWELLVTATDVILPMMYPSHYRPGMYGLSNPNGSPHTVIVRGLHDAERRSASVPGAAPIRPWYQDFTLGPPRYGVEQVRAQIEAGYSAGVMSWLLWNPRSSYTVAALKPKP
jgi:hypothetical protein